MEEKDGLIAKRKWKPHHTKSLCYKLLKDQWHQGFAFVDSTATITHKKLELSAFKPSLLWLLPCYCSGTRPLSSACACPSVILQIFTMFLLCRYYTGCWILRNTIGRSELGLTVCLSQLAHSFSRWGWELYFPAIF